MKSESEWGTPPETLRKLSAGEQVAAGLPVLKEGWSWKVKKCTSDYGFFGVECYRIYLFRAYNHMTFVEVDWVLPFNKARVKKVLAAAARIAVDYEWALAAPLETSGVEGVYGSRQE